MTVTIELQISSASCSTQPGFGKYCVNSFWETPMILELRSKMMARFDVVPASRAITYCFAMMNTSFYCV